MQNKWLKTTIFILVILIAASLYSKIIFYDHRDTSFFYYAYGVDKDVHFLIFLRWYFGVGLLFSFIFHSYKNEVSSKRANKIIRYKSKTRYNLYVVGKGVRKAVICWIEVVLLMGIIKQGITGIHLENHDVTIFIVSILTIITLATLLVFLDAVMESIFAFIIINIFILLSTTIGVLSKSPIVQGLLFPNYLMGIRYEYHQILYGGILLIVIEVIILILYIVITKRKDIML